MTSVKIPKSETQALSMKLANWAILLAAVDVFAEFLNL